MNPASCLLAALLTAAISICWFTVSLGISPMPSSRKTRRRLLAMVEALGEDPIADLGSGWGSLVIPLARRHPGYQVTGYEASWIPWLYSVTLKHLLGLDNLTLRRRNFLKEDLSAHRVLLCYLFRGGMARLEAKLDRESTADPHVFSNTFAFPGRRADHSERIDDLFRSSILHYRASQRQEAPSPATRAGAPPDPGRRGMPKRTSPATPSAPPAAPVMQPPRSRSPKR